MAQIIFGGGEADSVLSRSLYPRLMCSLESSLHCHKMGTSVDFDEKGEEWISFLKKRAALSLCTINVFG